MPSGTPRDNAAPVPPVAIPATMRAVVAERYGGIEALRVTERQRPDIASDEVLVQVYAAGLDRGQLHLLNGEPSPLRLALGLRRLRQPVMGLDVSGIVIEVGSAVTRFAPGDEVFGIARGSFADYAVAKESKLARKPAGLSHTAAAVVPVSGLTALQACRDAGRVARGDRVLVTGASGGVGSFAVQIAKASGATVTTVARAATADLVRSLGADEVIEADHLLAAGDGRFDVILFIAGTQSVRQLRRLLTPTGTLVVIGGEDNDRITGISRQLRAVASSPFVRQRLTMLVSKETHVDIEELGRMIEAGSLRASVGATYALADIAVAFGALADRQVRGKIAILPAPQSGTAALPR